MKICKIAGCDRKMHGRGLCRMHHMRQWRYGDVNYRKSVAKGEFRACTVDGCNERYKKNGYCQRHWYYYDRYGDALHITRVKRGSVKTCTVDGCNEKHMGKGLCQNHYRRMYRTGELEQQHYVACEIDGCNTWRNLKWGLCEVHFAEKFENKP